MGYTPLSESNIRKAQELARKMDSIAHDPVNDPSAMNEDVVDQFGLAWLDLADLLGNWNDEVEYVIIAPDESGHHAMLEGDAFQAWLTWARNHRA